MKNKCGDCRLIEDIKPKIINPENIDVAKDLANCNLHHKTVIVTDEACDEFMPKKKKEEK